MVKRNRRSTGHQQPLQLDTSTSYGLRARHMEVDLMMECEDEELAPCQLEALRKAQLEHDDANLMIKAARNGQKLIPASQPNTFTVVPQPESSAPKTVLQSIQQKSLTSTSSTNTTPVATVSKPTPKLDNTGSQDVILISESPPPPKVTTPVTPKTSSIVTLATNATPQQVYKFVNVPSTQPTAVSSGQWVIRPLVSVVPQQHPQAIVARVNTTNSTVTIASQPKTTQPKALPPTPKQGHR